MSLEIPLDGERVVIGEKKQAEKKSGQSIGALVVLVILALVFFWIWNSNKSLQTSVVSTPVPAPAATTPTKSRAAVGDAIALTGANSQTVTVESLLDPASVSQYAQPPAGTRYVGVKLQITNNSSSALNGNGNVNVTAVRSDNQAASIAFTAADDCTNFSSGSYTISAGSSVTGCVFFEVPNGMTLSSIQFNPNDELNSQTGEWVVK